MRGEWSGLAQRVGGPAWASSAPRRSDPRRGAPPAHPATPTECTAGQPPHARGPRRRRRGRAPSPDAATAPVPSRRAHPPFPARPIPYRKACPPARWLAGGLGVQVITPDPAGRGWLGPSHAGRKQTGPTNGRLGALFQAGRPRALPRALPRARPESIERHRGRQRDATPRPRAWQGMAPCTRRGQNAPYHSRM